LSNHNHNHYQQLI